jgi:hypothetical protein
MNTANLQLEGLCLAIAAINRELVAKGLLSPAEIETALRNAETGANSDHGSGHLSPANRDAVCFPIRLLQLANANSGEPLSFADLAKKVGETKYGDAR